MFFLLSQMTIGLLLAAIVGACIGWLLHRSRYLGQVDQYRKHVHRQQAQVKQAQSEVKMLNDDYDDLNRRSQAEIDTLKQETRQLPALNQNLEKSQLLVRQLMQKHEAQLREISTENETLKGKLKNINHREQALNQLEAGLEKTRRRAMSMSQAPTNDSDIDLTKPLGAAAAIAGAATISNVIAEDDRNDQTSLDLDDDGSEDPNDQLQYTDEVYEDDDNDGFDALEDDGAEDTEFVDDENDVEASDEDAEYDYVYEDEDDDEDADDDVEDEDDDADAEAEDDDWEYEYVYEDEEEDEDDDTEYLEDASDRMLRSEHSANQKNSKNKNSATRTRKKSGTEAAVAKQSALADPEPLEPLFDPVDQHDDLQQIFGIGPVTEKALNKLGITSYSQLAELKSHEIEKIADALQIFPGRIERDNWVGSATRQLEEVLEEL